MTDGDNDKSLDELLNALHKDEDPAAPLPGTSPNEMVKAHSRVNGAIAVQQIKQAIGPDDRHDGAAQGVDGRLREAAEKIIKDFDNVGDEILTKWRADREQQQEAINLLFGVVRAAENPGAVPRIYIEALVQALDTNANMSLTAVKLLDAKTRLLAATKSQVLIQNNVNQGSSGELERILLQPMESDLEET